MNDDFIMSKPVCVDILTLSDDEIPESIRKHYNPISQDKHGIIFNKIVSYLVRLGFVYDNNLQEFSRLNMNGIYETVSDLVIKKEIKNLVCYPDILPEYNLKTTDFNSILENLKISSNLFTLKIKFDKFLENESGIDYDLGYLNEEDGHRLIPLLNGIFNPCLKTENGQYPFTLLPHCGYFYPIVNPNPYQFNFKPILESDLYSYPESEDFLKILGDQDTLNFFLWWAGAVLFSNPFRLQCILLLYGPGGTGKTSLANCLGSIVGNSLGTPPLKGLTSPRGRASLIGKRLAIVSEMECAYNRDLISSLKDITGGIPIEADPKFKHPIMINPPALLFTGNVFPDVDTSDSGFMRRIAILDCSTQLEHGIDWIRLMSDNSHKNWLFNASYYVWMKNREKVIDDMKSESMRKMDIRIHLFNPFISWINDYCGTTEYKTIRKILDGRTLTDLYDPYELFVRDLKGIPIGKTKFSEKIQNDYRMDFIKSNGKRIFKVK